MIFEKYFFSTEIGGIGGRSFNLKRGKTFSQLFSTYISAVYLFSKKYCFEAKVIFQNGF